MDPHFRDSQSRSVDKLGVHQARRTKPPRATIDFPARHASSLHQNGTRHLLFAGGLEWWVKARKRAKLCSDSGAAP